MLYYSLLLLIIVTKSDLVAFRKQNFSSGLGIPLILLPAYSPLLTPVVLGGEISPHIPL